MSSNIQIVMFIYVMFTVIQLTRPSNSYSKTFSLRREDILPVLKKICSFANCTYAEKNYYTFYVSHLTDTCNTLAFLQFNDLIPASETAIGKPTNTDYYLHANASEARWMPIKEKRERNHFIAIIVSAVIISIIIAVGLAYLMAYHIKGLMQSDTYRVEDNTQIPSKRIACGRQTTPA